MWDVSSISFSFVWVASEMIGTEPDPQEKKGRGAREVELVLHVSMTHVTQGARCITSHLPLISLFSLSLLFTLLFCISLCCGLSEEAQGTEEPSLSARAKRLWAH